MLVKATCLSGKTILISGSACGIGFQTAQALAALKTKLILVDKLDLTSAKEQIVRKTNNSNIVTKCADFTSLASIRNLAQEVNREEERLDVLINNVGVFCLGKARTEDGLVGTMQVNHFGPFLLTHLLTNLLIKSAPSRVIFLASTGAFFHNLSVDNINNPEVASCDALSSVLVYYNSKLCSIITANGFASRLKNCGVTFNSVHPGMTATKFLAQNEALWASFKYLLQDAETGAQSSIFLATSKSLTTTSGKFFVDMKEHQQPRITTDLDFCDEIWEASEFFSGLTTEEKLVKREETKKMIVY